MRIRPDSVVRVGNFRGKCIGYVSRLDNFLCLSRVKKLTTFLHSKASKIKEAKSEATIKENTTIGLPVRSNDYPPIAVMI